MSWDSRRQRRWGGTHQREGREQIGWGEGSGLGKVEVNQAFQTSSGPLA